MQEYAQDELTSAAESGLLVLTKFSGITEHLDGVEQISSSAEMVMFAHILRP
jgi:hypothetical protein